MTVANAISNVFDTFPGATIETWEPEADDLGSHAIAYALAGLDVFPLAPRSKVPAIPKDAGGNGVLDATTDVATVARWWGRTDHRTRTGPECNIGGRVPAGAFVIDIDPRHGGDQTMATLVDDYGVLPATRTAISGRGDGGIHHWFRHPGGPLVMPRGFVGLDLKTSAGYLVLPPSVHPDTGQPYHWVDITAPIAASPRWLIELLRPARVDPPRTSPRWPAWATSEHSPADEFTATARWSDVLTGWSVVAGDGETDGSGWRHPDATSALSATIRYGMLFVYSTSTELEPTEPGSPHGYTKFRAFAVLQHGGDLSAAARWVIARRREAA